VPALPDKPDDAYHMADRLRGCLPDIDQAVSRIEQIQRESEERGRKLRRLYILTNAEPEYRSTLKKRLLEAGWDHVATSFDMMTRKEEVEVVVAADMMVAQLADVFIGNGFSSMSSNINLLRMGRKVDTDSIRFL